MIIFLCIMMGINTVSIIAIIVMFKQITEREKIILNNKIDGSFNEAEKRIKAVSNALPRTSREGALGYRVNLK